MKTYAASLGADERRQNRLVYGLLWGLGIGLSMPWVVYACFREPSLLRLAALIPVATILSHLFLARVSKRRPIAFVVDEESLFVERPTGRKKLADLKSVERITYPAEVPALNRGVRDESGESGSMGFHGYWGTFKSPEHGQYPAWLTNVRNTVQLQLDDGTFVFVSPDDPAAFAQAVCDAGEGINAAIEKSHSAVKQTSSDPVRTSSFPATAATP